MVQAVVKLNAAQLAFVRKLADDPAFASQFDQAMSSGNHDVAASLAASATGIAKSSIYVGTGGGRDDHQDAASASTTPTPVFRLASRAAVERKGNDLGLHLLQNDHRRGMHQMVKLVAVTIGIVVALRLAHREAEHPIDTRR